MIVESNVEIPSYDHAGLVSRLGGRAYIERPSSHPAIAKVWTCRGPLENGIAHRVLPDACIEIVLDVAAPEHPYVVGPSTRAYTVPLAASAEIVGVRLRVGACIPVLATHAWTLRDTFQPWPLTLTYPRGASAEECAHCLEGWVGHREPSEVDKLTDAVLRANGSVASAASSLGLGERRFRRAFANDIGLGPKRFWRIQRLWSAMALKRDSPDLAWGEIAAESGFADHAHLDREFLTLTNGTPSDWFREFTA